MQKRKLRRDLTEPQAFTKRILVLLKLMSIMDLGALEVLTTTMARLTITGEVVELVAVTIGVN